MDSNDDSIDVDLIDAEVDRDLGWDKGKKPTPRRSPAYWQALLHGIRPSSPVRQFLRKTLQAISAVVFFPIFSPFSIRQHDVDGNVSARKRPMLWRFLDGLLMRILLTPVILGLFLIVLVWLTTHPQHVHATQSPLSVNLIFRDVDLLTSDGQRLSGWYIAPLSVEDVQFSGDRVLGQKWPSAVLCHGLGYSQDQYLPLARSLHDAGFAVLLLDLRGQGASDPAAVTYGIRERLDVIAGVKFLRDLSNVDPAKVCVVGQGIAATAVLHAAALDSSIAAVVADGVCPSFDGRVRTIFDRPNFPTRWLSPLYEITFEMMLRERTAELNLVTLTKTLTRQPILYLAYPSNDQAPVEEILALAEGTTAPHQTLVTRPGQEAGDPADCPRITEFLTQAVHWVSPRQRVQLDIQQLRQSQMK